MKKKNKQANHLKRLYVVACFLIPRASVVQNKVTEASVDKNAQKLNQLRLCQEALPGTLNL